MPNSVIEEDLIVDGNIEAKEGSVAVKGRVTGDIAARAIEVLEGGQVKGAMSAESVSILGTHAGSISCDELSLHSTSDVKSDVTAKRMSSEKGAKLVGKVQITGN